MFPRSFAVSSDLREEGRNDVPGDLYQEEAATPMTTEEMTAFKRTRWLWLKNETLERNTGVSFSSAESADRPGRLPQGPNHHYLHHHYPARLRKRSARVITPREKPWKSGRLCRSSAP